MLSKKVIVKNTSGLHARPANVFVGEALKHRSQISIRKNGTDYNAKSILAILKACVKANTEIEIIADGCDEEQALASIVNAIESGLGELPAEV